MTYPLPLELPPLDIVRQLSEHLQPNVPRLILDAGTGTGRNARFLARLGHIVVSLDRSLEELGTSAAEASILGDVQQLPFGTVFDIALMNEVTHMLPRKGYRALSELRRVTRQGGLNVVSGYLALAGRTNARNAARMFQGEDLRANYTSAGWGVLYYREHVLPNQYVGHGAAQKEHVFSRSMIIAQRPWLRD